MWEAVELGLMIYIARVGDVSLGTLRTMAMVRGAKLVAFGLGFVEAALWIFAVSSIFNQLDDLQSMRGLILVFFYCAGYASGIFVGLTIEERLAIGERVVRIFTRQPEDISALIRAKGIPVTEFVGAGRDGPISLLYCGVKRRKVEGLLKSVKDMDDKAFWVIEDIRKSRRSIGSRVAPAGLKGIFQRK